jgi:hypothetical protein
MKNTQATGQSQPCLASGTVPAMPGSPIMSHQEKFQLRQAVQSCGIRKSPIYAWQSNSVASEKVLANPGWQSYSVASGQVPAMPNSPSLWQPGPVPAIHGIPCLCLPGLSPSYTWQSQSVASKSNPAIPGSPSL